ncbi:MAG: (Fe-S)-binding protein [Nitrospirota bacterium]
MISDFPQLKYLLNETEGINLPSANLYLEEIDFLKYLNGTGYAECGVTSCEEFVEAIKRGLKKPEDCPFLNRNRAQALEISLTIHKFWPEVPLLTHPRPGTVGLVELNSPDTESTVLISGNNEYTEQILMSVLSTTKSPFFIMFVDTDGNTVDMSMIYQTLTAERIYLAMKENNMNIKVKKKEIIIPGFASSLKEDVEKLSGWNVRVGPVCAAEIPLFLSDMWIPP